MREKTLLLVYGEGGHRAQMRRFYAKIENDVCEKGLRVVGLCEKGDEIDLFKNYVSPPFRDKYSWIRTAVVTPVNLFRVFHLIFSIFLKYKVVGVVSTGPGLSILPSVFFKLLGAKVVFIETWSRFETQSLTGRVMYFIADRFYYQNKSLGRFYPSGKYGGLL
ncbi:PssD/Cps14F family polysaccharide biosynthesis glycosyltransferase [Zoogloea sp.]|uniref:PssD/Cps14F family polysaccharide biosynthesis glycosyltransferase n=1 Tax=Zoogloea sp. TaxID=49181 RepID=UPI0035B4EA5F